MAADSTKNLRDGRAEALRALVNSLAPGQTSCPETPSNEDISVLSEKLKELLGDADPPQEGVQRNERGELLNQQGLPIIEITEPIESLPQPSPGASSGPIVNAGDPGFVPMYRLPPAERARSRAQMDRILDILEEEERVEEGRKQVRDWEQRREELEQRKANAMAELERIKTAKDMQKKMGKALLKNMADARKKEEMERARQEQEDLELEEVRRSRKPRKSVSWAELPKQEKPSVRSNPDADDGRAPVRTMRPNVVERFPIRSGAASPPPPVPVSDSDDESNPEQSLTDGSQDEDETGDSDGSGDRFDIDSIQHQREIALAYFKKRNAIGADGIPAHSPDLSGENEEDRDVPLDATRARPRPKPSQPRFRSDSERLAQAYGTRQTSLTAAPSLSSSALPRSTDALRGVVRMGRLEANQLVDDDDSDSEHDAVPTREFMDALYRGDVTNAGAAGNSDALIAALESAYGAPPKQPPAVPHATATEPAPARAHIAQKNSRFKLTRAAPPSTLAANDEGPREGSTSPSRPPLPTSNNTVVERKAVRPHATAPSSSSPAPAPPGALGSRQPTTTPPMIVDSPSFAPPGGDAPVTIIDSPSFRPPLPSARLARPAPPAVLASSVRESSGATQQQQQQALVPEPGKPVSRFKAQRAES